MTIVFIISAPSGSGKSTLVSRLLAGDPALMFSISYTTRKPRGAEVDGQSYHFVSREDFEAMLARDEFLEWAEVFGNYYGTHRGILEGAQAGGKDLVLDIDVQGARQLKGKIPEAVSVFILAPSRQILEQRLRARSEDSDATIERRLRDAAVAQAEAATGEMTAARARAQKLAADAQGEAKAAAAARQAGEDAKLAQTLAAAETRIAAARAAAMAHVRAIAIEAAQAMITRLTGTAAGAGEVERALGNAGRTARQGAQV